MHDPYSEEAPLSSDLEWMLLSNQAGRDLLLQALIEEFAQPLDEFLLPLCDTREQAEQLRQATLASVVLNRYRYPNNLGVRIWIYQTALEKLGTAFERPAPPLGPGDAPAVWLALDALSRRQRLLLTLRYRQAWSLLDIARLLHSETTTIETEINRALERFDAGHFHRVDPDLVQELQRGMADRWPVHSLSEPQRQALSAGITREVENRSARRRRSASLKELLFVFAAVFLIAGFLGGVNLLLPEPEIPPTAPARTVVVITQLVYVQSTPTPPAPTATPDERQYPQRAVFYPAQENDTLRVIADRLRLDLQRLMEWNPWQPGEQLHSGQLVVIGTQPEPAASLTPVPAMASLDLNASAEKIRQEISSSPSRWSTLWVDGVVVYYGPPGYTGQPEVRRDQVWVSQPYNSLVITGPYDEPADHVWYALDGKVYDVDMQTGRPLLYDFHSSSLPVYSTLVELIFPETLANSLDDVQVVGQETFAGREALVITWPAQGDRPEGRAWVDLETGMLLRLREYAASRAPARELAFNRVVFDPYLPLDLFDRSNLLLQFAEDERGHPADDPHGPVVPPDVNVAGFPMPPQLTPAPDLNPAAQELVFQWSEPAQYNNFQSQFRSRRIQVDDPFFQEIPVQVYAGAAYLGEIRLNPWNAICARSPDGGRLAAIYAAEIPAQDGSPALIRRGQLKLFDLTDLSSSFTLPEIIAGDTLAFSPDGRSLALSGCTARDACGIFLLDLESGRSEQLALLGDAVSLVWSPDGRYLAAQGVLANPALWGLLVVRVADGQVVYSQPWNPASGELPSNAPVSQWDVSFPALDGGLEACQARPGNG